MSGDNLAKEEVAMDSADINLDSETIGDEIDEGEMVDQKDDEMMVEEDEALAEDAKDDEMMSEHDEAMTDDAKEDEMMAEKDESMSEEMMTPEWFSADLTDAKTGETFTIADFEGKVVLVETLAMWCSNCLKQQGQVAVLHELLGDRMDFVSLGIDIDPNENAAALKAYTEKNGFDWLYTVAPVDVAREIGQLYGDQFLNPPSTPMLIIDRDGHVHPLPFGIKSAESLMAALEPFLDG
jgi:hypothetical protein